jgi:arginine-tRNA-protein transferase
MLQNYLAPHPKHVQFLVESHFVSNTTNDNDTTTHHKEGSFHQQYWIGDVLIAVGVVDVLPNGLSSVYLYYHPGMSHSLVALGKLATLKEIEYTRDILKKPYYYLGYYIESCPKMRYKADYHTSQLLCPVHYQWVDCDEAIPKLQSTTPRHLCALAGDPTVRDTGSGSTAITVPDVELAQIPMDIGAGFAVTLDMLQENGKLVARPILQEFFVEAGPDMSRKCLLKLA